MATQHPTPFARESCHEADPPLLVAWSTVPSMRMPTPERAAYRRPSQSLRGCETKIYLSAWFWASTHPIIEVSSSEMPHSTAPQRDVCSIMAVARRSRIYMKRMWSYPHTEAPMPKKKHKKYNLRAASTAGLLKLAIE
ncbi:predicted protein [Verticillium alfalfae VaMs.102]|uniref:Predicted protein n=1 Tax=Verticillium alfalfae (strain VaMs.102 / ATCC MYA-4576 / FGSC 10136) TaxID=526221 RepID=C9SX03_VERA1|nr:predicted protein [Verticillium alfalfae VaMs.102]EEY23544.1 predicted protein [Verticillium alfalfae VaMs.102]